MGRAVRWGAESLEQRLLFIVLGDTFVGNTTVLTPDPGFDTYNEYEFIQTNGNTVRVAWHDMAFELIGASVGTPNNTQGLPVDTPTETDLFTAVPVPPAVLPTDLPNLFTIYILQSTPDSWLSIAQAPAVGTTGAQPATPFGSSAGFQVLNAGLPATASGTVTYTATGAGSVLLGALNNGTTDANTPIIEMPFASDGGASIGPIPEWGIPLTASDDFGDATSIDGAIDFSGASPMLRAGVYMSPVALELNPDDPINPADVIPSLDANGDFQPNDIGRFMFGGTIFGNVNLPAAPTVAIPQTPVTIAPGLIVDLPAQGPVPAAPASQGGNVGIFYAGAILTGDAAGVGLGEGGITTIDGTLVETGTQPAPNFIIGGDLRDLITNSSIGGDVAGGNRLDNSRYYTGFNALIAGTVGEVYLNNGNFFGIFDAEHDPSVYGLPDNLLTEDEWVAQVQGATPAGDYFIPDDSGELATLPDISAPLQEDPAGDANDLAFPSLPPMLPSSTFNNDTSPTTGTLGTPQYLGSIKETDPKTGLPVTTQSGAIVYESTVNGILENADPSPETIDNYAVPLLAGQTIAMTLSEFEEEEEETTDPNTGLITISEVKVALAEEILQVQLIDPDGRIVATNNNKNAPDLVFDQTFEYTPDRPGVYDLKITLAPDLATPEGDIYYNLNVEGVGDMALGTIAAPGGNIWDAGYDPAIQVGSEENIIDGSPVLDADDVAQTNAGDLGALLAGANIASDISDTTVPDGDLRVMKAASLGILVAAQTTNATTGVVTPGAFGDGPILAVPDGDVGLLEAFDPAGIFDVGTPMEASTGLNPLPQDLTVPVEPIGGDIQRIDGLGNVYLDTANDGGIGTINAASMISEPASYIEVNADNVGNDGIIGLIDVTGDLGDLTDGGPGIVTNNGGYVKYMRVGGNIFQDLFFGGDRFPSNTTYNAGQTVTITDDTGATVQFAPQGPTTTLQVPDPNNPNLPETEVFGPQVNLTTYGIRDKGGPVIVDASVTNNFVSGAVETLFGGTTEVLTGQAEGLTITANSNGAANPEADISSIGIEGESTSTVGLATNATTGLPVLDANGEQELAQNTPAAATATTTTTTVNTLSLIINGTAAVDVMDVVGFVQTADTPADVTEIENNTPGEITTVSAATIGVLSSHGSIGLAATTSTGTAILPTEVLGLFQTWDPVNNKPVAGAAGPGNVFPWNQQAIGVVTTGDVLIIEAYQGVGNVDVVGDIGAVVANADGKLTPGGFDGIAGPIIADMPTPGVAGRILSVSIGQGILPSGSGEVGFAGLYAQGDIGTVTNNGLPQADIRGNIVSNEAIDNINLTNGSIINDKILSSAPIAAFGDSEDTSFGFTSPGTGSTISSPTNEIRNITINGRGGIIGILIDATDVGPITVGSQGFGIFETGIALTGNGVLGKITAGGYGIRNSTFIVGAVAQGLNATGNGSQLPVTAFGTDVRPSDLGDGFDPYSGLEVNPLNDLNANLGTSAGTPVITGATDTGVLQDDDVRATTSLNSVNAQTIRTGTPLFVPLITPEFNIPVVGQLYAMEFNVAGLIGSVNVRGNIDGLEITTGRLGSFIQRGSVSRLGISVAGTIASLVIHGNLGQTVTDLATNTPEPDSYISATGAEGSIGTLTVYGNLNADITANDTITRLTVGGNVNGSIFAEGQTTGLTLGYLRVGGAIADGSLIVDGNAGTIITNGSLGSPTGALTIEGNLNSLSVGASHGRGAGLELPLHVEGSVGSLTVFGRIDGTVQIDGDLKKLKVTNDGTQSNIINGNMTVNGRLYTANIINGNIAANVIANGFIKSFTISRGSVQSDGSVQSQIDAIQNFRITGGAPYGMFGSLLAASGFNENIDISGNVGDGIDAADITAATGNKFRVRGSIRTNATIAVSGQLNVLQVDHNIETNANVSAHPLKKLIVGGTNTGNVITV